MKVEYYHTRSASDGTLFDVMLKLNQQKIDCEKKINMRDYSQNHRIYVAKNDATPVGILAYHLERVQPPEAPIKDVVVIDTLCAKDDDVRSELMKKLPVLPSPTGQSPPGLPTGFTSGYAYEMEGDPKGLLLPALQEEISNEKTYVTNFIQKREAPSAFFSTLKVKARRKRNRRKSRKGGRYVSEGSYGCGYSPALRCEGEAEREPGAFSKLMDANEAAKEFEIGQRLFKQIDPNNDYFLYPYKMCKINTRVLPNPENNIGTCRDKFRSLAYSRILQYKNGGGDITKPKLKLDEYTAYFGAFKNLFDGLVKLHKANVAHMDIKLGNVVGLKSGPSSFYFRYIDFGLSLDTNESYPLEDSVYANDYFAWPFDTRFLVEGFSEYDITTKTVNEFYSNATYFQSFIPLEVFYEPDNTIRTSYANDYRLIFQQFEDIPNDQKVSFITKGSDVYALGQLISIVYAKKIGHFYRYGIQVVLDPRNLNSKIALKDLRLLVKPDVYVWHQAVFNNVSVPLYNLVKRMMDWNPFTRIKIDEARAEYIKLLPEMSKYFKPELLQKGLGVYNPSVLALPPVPPTPNTPAPFKLSPLHYLNKSMTRQNGQRRLLSANAPAFVPGSRLTRKRKN